VTVRPAESSGASEAAEITVAERREKGAGGGCSTQEIQAVVQASQTVVSSDDLVGINNTPHPVNLVQGQTASQAPFKPLHSSAVGE